MSTDSFHKRTAEAPEDRAAGKRPRSVDEVDAGVAAATPTDGGGGGAAAAADSVAELSLEALLAVPLDLLLHRAAGARSKPLLTRAEAQCLASVALLAHELDSLVAVSARILERRHVYGGFATKLRRGSRNRRLVPLLSILHVMGQDLAGQSLERIGSELEAVHAELRLAAAHLKQFSEQNWTLSESLWDAGPECRRVAGEKRKLSDIQDELGNRIAVLLDGGATDADADSTATRSGAFPPAETMADYCARIMARLEDLSSPPRSSQQSASQPSAKAQSQTQSQDSVRSESKIPPRCAAEKENDDPRQWRGPEGSPASDEDHDEPPSSPPHYGRETQRAAEALSSFVSLGGVIHGEGTMDSQDSV